MQQTEILECGHPEDRGPYAYGIDSEGNRHCYACCAARDAREMAKTGRAVLYLMEPPVRACKLPMGTRTEGTGYTVTNWPSSLVLPVDHVSRGRHNIAGTRIDVWFTGPDGARWHGVQYGEWTQLCHCRRIKG